MTWGNHARIASRPGCDTCVEDYYSTSTAWRRPRIFGDACEQMAAQCKEVGSGDEEDGALDVADRFEQWLKQRSAAENEIEAALLRELNSHWVMIILVAACLAYFFFFKR
jgi:hypothetical protein